MKHPDQIYQKYEKKMKSGGMAFYIESGDGTYQWLRESGNMVNKERYGIASISKMFTTTLILKLEDEGKLNQKDKISIYLSSDILNRLPKYKGKDVSKQLTIHNLLAQTSGIPDYYTEALKDDLKAADQMSDDPVMTMDTMLEWLKCQQLKFDPVKEKKAHYSDMNFDLLGVIIEKVTKESFSDNVVKYITKPLDLQKTRVFSKDMAIDFPGAYYKGEIIYPKNVLLSGPASGGIVSTVDENMKFLKAFWNGKLFDQKHLSEIKVYHPIQFIPLKYGVGHMKFKQIGTPEFIGHSGSTGTVCYYIPQQDLYITGTINECNEAKSIRMMVRLINQCMKQR